MPATVYEPFPGRGSVVARLRGDGTGGEPLLLLSHLDVVPAPADRWTHDPFAADVADGYIYGRGAVDMKDLVAMEVEVVRLLAESATRRRAGPRHGRRSRACAGTCSSRSPRTRRPAGTRGSAGSIDHHPEHLRAAGAINESGGVSLEVGGRRLYPIQVAEKGYAVYRLTFRGTWGHGSMPRPDNAAVLAAEAIARLAVPGRPRVTPVMRAFFESAAEVARRRGRHAPPGDGGRRLAAGPRRRSTGCARRSTRAPPGRSSATRSPRTSSMPA